MTKLLHEIEWEDALFPFTTDAAWEAEVVRALGAAHPWALHTAGSPWIRNVLLDIHRVPLAHTPGKLIGIAQLVSSQENACRYCYGASRAHLRILGMDEATIDRLERDTQIADSDELQRVFVAFCRNLSRSNPRPAAKERAQLEALGLEPIVVAEVAFWIAAICALNRVTTLLATPPFAKLESMAYSWWGKLLRPLFEKKFRQRALQADYSGAPRWDGPYGRLVDLLDGSPAGPMTGHWLRDCFTTGPLARETKLYMFAVVARSLQCQLSVDEAASGLDLVDGALEDALATLTTDAIPEDERRLLAWVRETVWYEPAAVQRQTQALMEQLGQDKTLDAIGTAALANSCVRLTMLAT